MNNGRPWSYDRAVTHGFFRDTRPVGGPVVDRGSALAMVAGIGVFAVGSMAWRAAPPIRLAVAAALLVATFMVVLGVLATYVALTERAHLRVVDHPEMGDVRRWAIFGSAAFGYPLLLLALLLGAVAASQGLGGTSP